MDGHVSSPHAPITNKKYRFVLPSYLLKNGHGSVETVRKGKLIWTQCKKFRLKNSFITEK